MKTRNDNRAPRGLRGWWMSPPRSGLQLIISPPEYRHLRGCAQLRIAGGTVLACLALIVLGAGGSDAKTYVWTMVFLVPAVAHMAFASWELRIARSHAAAI